MPKRLAVFDYQNVHLTAHDVFAAYGAPAPSESTLAHPLHVAERIARKRHIASDLIYVRVFRGRPNPERHQGALSPTMRKRRLGSRTLE